MESVTTYQDICWQQWAQDLYNTGKKETLPMIQDLETKIGEKAAMAKLTLYIHNRNVTEFKQKRLLYILHVTWQGSFRPLKYDF